ncbi:hypothetical protein F4820DRAFT_402389 [Hypoxylon rubiginosum]|uniref:Uncharacterized protein n=1 Tax=Hypoxylon rubiginosum TaxID=110542 RepID=A0ACB9ZJY4_9PEZI|nr:hypothetical protein F4820DRAFT_402389 [Hypoxylon rubiginosum]
MPPNSFCEWMVGRNVVRNKAPKKPRPVFSVALETDDDSEQDTLKLTYPRTGRSRRTKRATGSKRVHFKESVQNAEVEQAIAQLPLDSDSQVSSEPETSPDESATDDDLIMDCPCTNCISARRKLKKSKQAKARSKKHQTDSSADEDEGSPASVHAKHKAKKAKEEEALKSKGNSSKQKGKPQAKKVKAKSESEAETTDATDAETGPETGVDTGTNTEGATSEGDTTEAQTTEAETTGADTGAESEKEAPKDTGKKKGKGKQGEQAKKDKQSSPNGQESKKGKKVQQESQDDQSNSDEENPKRKSSSRGNKPLSVQETMTFLKQARRKRPEVKVKVKSKSLPLQNPPPEIRQANFLMRPRPHVLQVEHAVEVQDDPRPNAFFDNVNGIMRVYHGPVYGNPYGTLYPNRVYGNQSLPLPVGTPHPTQNPWYNGFAGAPGQYGTPSTQPVSGYSASPQAPPSTNTSGAPGKDQWLQGYSSVTIGQSPDKSQSPSPAAGSDRKQQESAKRQSSPTSESSKKTQKNIDEESNVLPSIEVTSPEKAQGSNGNGSKPGDIQSAHGSPTGSASKDEKNGRSKKEGRKNGSKKRSPDKGKSYSTVGSFLDEAMAKDEAAAKSRNERWSQSDKSGSKEPSPVLQENDTPADADLNLWGPNNEEIAENAATQDDFWGDNNNTPTGSDTQAESNGAGLSKGNDGTSDWNGGGNSGGNTDAPDSVGGSADASEQAGTQAGSDGPNNVLGGNDGSTGSVDDEKKTNEERHKEKKSNGKKSNGKKSNGDSHQHANANSTEKPIPGGWVGSPTKSEFSYTERPPRASPDNVGGNWSGSNNSGSNSGSPDKSTSGTVDDWGDYSKSNDGFGNGGSGEYWQHPDVAQDSGGAFETDDGYADFGGANKGANNHVTPDPQW